MHAAVFDMDGLLIDSEPFWRQAERQVFATVGLDLSDAQCQETQGMRTDEVVAYWYAQAPWRGKSCEAVRVEVIEAVGALVERSGQALPGVYDTLEMLRSAGLRLALASSSPHELIRAVVRRLGLDDWFEALCSAVDHPRGKPDPAVYLEAAERLGIEPGHCLAFEDSAAGVRAARAAGMAVVAVPEVALYERPDFALADLKLTSLEQFSVASLDGLRSRRCGA